MPEKLGDIVDVCLWRNTRKGMPAKRLATMADYPSRGYRPGEPTALHAAETQSAADKEFLHAHSVYAGVEIRTTTLAGRLLLVDGTRDAIATALGTTPSQLSHPSDYSACQRVASELFAQGVQALRILSARSRSGDSVVIVERAAALALLQEVEIVYRVIGDT